MSQSIRMRFAVGAIAVLLLIIVARTIRNSQEPPPPDAEPQATPEIIESDRGRTPGIRVPVKARSATPRPSRRDTATTRPAGQSLLEGYLIDDFRGWSALPENYHAENMEVAAGALLIRGQQANTSEPVTAMLESPPLLLRQPTLQAPADNRRPLPEGAEVHLQLQLSRDGQNWSSWAMAEHYRKPDGTLALPMPVPSLPPGALPPGDIAAESVTGESTDQQSSGPLVRYRLTLTLRSPEPLTIRDVRLWKKLDG